jgi:hypothetical protein
MDKILLQCSMTTRVHGIFLQNRVNWPLNLPLNQALSRPKNQAQTQSQPGLQLNSFL